MCQMYRSICTCAIREVIAMSFSGLVSTMIHQFFWCSPGPFYKDQWIPMDSRALRRRWLSWSVDCNWLRSLCTCAKKRPVARRRRWTLLFLAAWCCSLKVLKSKHLKSQDHPCLQWHQYELLLAGASASSSALRDAISAFGATSTYPQGHQCIQSLDSLNFWDPDKMNLLCFSQRLLMRPTLVTHPPVEYNRQCDHFTPTFIELDDGKIYRKARSIWW